MMSANDNERWLPVPGFDGYEVSDMGRVRSVTRTRRYERTLADGRVIATSRLHQGVLLRPGTVKSGHQLVMLGRGQPKLVHALVLSAFVGPRPDGHDSCHYDGDPANNRLANLRWGTRSENVQDAKRHGTLKGGCGAGEDHPRARLDWQAVRAIRAAQNISTAQMAAKFGVSRSAIKSVRSGKTWAENSEKAA